MFIVLILNLNSIRLKIKQLLTCHCGCHGNLVIIKMGKVLDAYYPEEAACEI